MRRALILLLSLQLTAGGIPKDKLQHFAAGALIGASASVAFRWSGGGRLQSTRIGISVGIGAALLKEGVDQYAYQQSKAISASYANDPRATDYVKQGTGAFGRGADAGDALATIAGACAGAYIVHKIWK